MSPARSKTLTGLGVGLVAAGAAAAAGLAADRLVRARNTAIALDSAETYERVADEELVVVADDGVPLHVEVDHPTAPATGTGPVPTVVLSHGYTLSLRCWVFQRRALTAAGYRVVVWDQRGHGRSGSGSPEHYEVDQLGQDLARVIAGASTRTPRATTGRPPSSPTLYYPQVPLPRPGS